MSPFIIDLLVWILLFAGIGFGLLAFFGLLIFPDIRSRRFTATRSLLISISLLAGAVLVFGLYKYPDGGAEYPGLLIRTILLWVLLVITTLFVSRHISRQVSADEAVAHGRP